jgi:nitrate/nitrite transporter NarK
VSSLLQTNLERVGLTAILCVGLSLVPVGAHVFELVRKMALPPDQYMIVQSIYAGWGLFGIVILAAIALTSLYTLLARETRPAHLFSLLACICLIVTQIIFWAFTYPMNAATDNWTRMPDNFEAARRQWEYSHAANAVITFAAFVAITLAVIAGKRGRLVRQPVD